jgi:F0F1-type ATP synthase membrane subunit a
MFLSVLLVCLSVLIYVFWASQVPSNNPNDVQDVSDFMPFDSSARELERKFFEERNGERGL